MADWNPSPRCSATHKLVIYMTTFSRRISPFFPEFRHFLVSARGKLGLTLPWQFKGTFQGISVGYEFRIGKAKRRRYLWKRKNCQSSVKARPKNSADRVVFDVPHEDREAARKALAEVAARRQAVVQARLLTKDVLG